MAALDENFRTLLVDKIADEAVPVEQDNIGERRPAVRVWYQRRNQVTELHLNGSKGLTRANFDVEVHATDLDTAQVLANRIAGHHEDGGLNGYRGSMGDQTVKGVFVESQDDDYEAKGLDGDEGYHLAALSVQVVTG